MKCLWLLLAGCTFHVAGVAVRFDDDLAVPAEADLSSLPDLTEPEPDLEELPDLTGACPPGCTLGCSTVGGAHCKVFYPSGGAVQLADVAPTGVMAATFGGSVLMHTDTGQIEGGFTRAAGTGVVGGIAFRVANGIGIFSFASLTVGPGVILSFT